MTGDVFLWFAKVVVSTYVTGRKKTNNPVLESNAIVSDCAEF